MSEKVYIEKEALLDRVRESRINNTHFDDASRRAHENEHRHFEFMVFNTPPASVAPIVKGEWADVEVRQYGELWVASMRCNACNRYHNEVYIFGNPTEDRYFCPNCGAKMTAEAAKMLEERGGKNGN